MNEIEEVQQLLKKTSLDLLLVMEGLESELDKNTVMRAIHFMIAFSNLTTRLDQREDLACRREWN